MDPRFPEVFPVIHPQWTEGSSKFCNRLDKVYPYATELDWKTNDTLFGTPPPAGLSPWGKPGFPGDLTAQYVPTSGHVVFPAGTRDQTVYVRNINQQNVPITIGVIMTNCVYDTLLESCQKFFGQ